LQEVWLVIFENAKLDILSDYDKLYLLYDNYRDYSIKILSESVYLSYCLNQKNLPTLSVI